MVADQRRCPGCELIEQAQDQTPKDAKGIKTYLIGQTDPETYAEGQRVRERGRV